MTSKLRTIRTRTRAASVSRKKVSSAARSVVYSRAAGKGRFGARAAAKRVASVRTSK